MVNPVSVIEELIKYIDDSVKELSRAKFTFKKAFHVTSRLATRIFIEICVPRQCVIKTFKAGNMSQIGGAILWSSLQSLDIAMKFKTTGFKNLEIVSSELVKFLLVNTGYESIQRLESQVAELVASKRESDRAVKEATSTAKSACNKLDEFKIQYVALEKRVKRLE